MKEAEAFISDALGYQAIGGLARVVEASGAMKHM
jgi:hypothetical protein